MMLKLGVDQLKVDHLWTLYSLIICLPVHSIPHMISHVAQYMQDGYEFAGGLHVSAFVDEGVWCHLNFVAKSKDDAEYLMFSELRRLPDQSEYEVLVCRNLGPAAARMFPC